MVIHDRAVYQVEHAAQLIMARRLDPPPKGRIHLRRPVDVAKRFFLAVVRRTIHYSGDPIAEQWDRDEAAVAHRLKQEEEQHYREVLARLEAEKARLDQEVEDFLSRHPEALKTSKIPPPKKPRNRKIEDHLSKSRQAAALAKVRIDRDANGG